MNTSPTSAGRAGATRRGPRSRARAYTRINIVFIYHSYYYHILLSLLVLLLSLFAEAHEARLEPGRFYSVSII